MTLRVTLEEGERLTGQLKHWAYNSSDCTQTNEVAGVLLPKLKARPRCLRTYLAEMAYQSPAMSIMLRGIRVDIKARSEVLKELSREIDRGLAAVAGRPEVAAVWDGRVKETGQCKGSTRKDGRHKWEKWEKDKDEAGRVCTSCGASRFTPVPFNANSSAQARHLFGDLLGVKRHDMRNKKGDHSADDEVLERIKSKYPKLRELVEDIQEVRDLKKQYGEVNAKLSPLGRYLTSMSIGATWSGRSSSSKNPMGYGGNVQNKAERHRRMFVADPGYVLINADLKQAESFFVAHRAEDPGYIEAHEKGDVHTYVTAAVWPELEWTGELSHDKKIARQQAPWDDAEGHDYRWYGKRNTHGYAYGISPAGTARQARAPLKDAVHAHAQLDKAFPNIKGKYHPEVIERVRNGLPIVTVVGREIQLMGRPWDTATWRQGFSAEPQSVIAELVWLACWHIWHDHDFPGAAPEIQLLQNGYDSLLCQCREEDVEAAVKVVVKAMEIPVLMPSGKVLTIGVEAAVGKSWGKASEDNPDGLRGVCG